MASSDVLLAENVAIKTKKDHSRFHALLALYANNLDSPKMRKKLKRIKRLYLYS